MAVFQSGVCGGCRGTPARGGRAGNNECEPMLDNFGRRFGEKINLASEGGPAAPARSGHQTATPEQQNDAKYSLMNRYRHFSLAADADTP